MTEIVYWDSDVFLGYIQEEPGKVELCDGTMQRAIAGELVIVTSTLTIAEVLWLRGGPRLSADRADLVRKIFRRSCFRLRNVTRAIAENSQDLVWGHDIRPKDAVHVATALDAKAPILETFDAGLLRKSGLVGLPPLTNRKRASPSRGPSGSAPRHQVRHQPERAGHQLRQLMVQVQCHVAVPPASDVGGQERTLMRRLAGIGHLDERLIDRIP
jgi:predicted nucleic acid-binding protein